MEYKLLGNTGLKVSELCLGTMTFGGRNLERDLVPLLLDQKLGLMVWSPLVGGFLSGNSKRDRQYHDRCPLSGGREENPYEKVP